MPKTETELFDRVHELNLSRAHHRPLLGSHGYHKILSVDLVNQCIELARQKTTDIRVLDIGCGDGYALAQLANELDKAGLGDRFAFYGLGINRYDPMFIPPEHFFGTGLIRWEPDEEMQFDLIISVYTFHYIWHKLEGIERIHNELLSEHGRAFIHFPGYLLAFSEQTASILQDERTGNQEFSSFLQRLNEQNATPSLRFTLSPYCIDDTDDDIITTECGVLSFTKDTENDLSFQVLLQGFSIFDEGFTFGSRISGLSYVSSYYELKPSQADSRSKMPPEQRSSSVCRIITLGHQYRQHRYRFHMAIHHLNSPTIVGIFPAATEELPGTTIPYRRIADLLHDENVGAVVRCNGPSDPSVDFHHFNDHFVRLFLDYILANAESICGHADPTIYLMGYSSGGSAVAAAVSRYPQVKKVLLLAPSYDSDEERLKTSLRQYTGELYVVAGEKDAVVVPDQVAWFYFHAKRAHKRKCLQVPSCSHSFDGHTQTVLDALLWAFADGKDVSECRWEPDESTIAVSWKDREEDRPWR